jgi:peptidoglycan/LPS O-acetylase OafA/YrhL
MRYVGPLIGAGFGLAWWIVAVSAVHNVSSVFLVLVGLVIAAALVAVAVGRAHGEEEAAIDPRRFATIGVAEVAGMVAVIVVANLAGVGAWIPGLIAVVVGAHFLLLASLFRQPHFAWTGALMVTAGATGVAIALLGVGPATVQVTVGLLCTVTLWGTTLQISKEPAAPGAA